MKTLILVFGLGALLGALGHHQVYRAHFEDSAREERIERLLQQIDTSDIDHRASHLSPMDKEIGNLAP